MNTAFTVIQSVNGRIVSDEEYACMQFPPNDLIAQIICQVKERIMKANEETV